MHLGIFEMKLVAKNIHYAVKSLLYIAHEANKIVPVSELANKLNMQRASLRRILQILSKHKILKSLKGRGGGFELNIQPNKVRIMDIVKIFRGKSNIIYCLLEKDVFHQLDDCLLMKEMKKIESKLCKALRTITIATLLKSLDRKL